jgi:glycosyltransferase involved in cell wall biosynthesis
MTTEFVHHIKAAKKVAWVHTDFHRFADGSEVFKFYDSFEKIICVSKSVEISVLGNIENAKNKTELIYNSLVINKIINGSSVELDFLKRGDAEIVLVSVGRFVKAKGFERIVDIAIKLREDHIKFIWYVVGDGELWEAINLNIMMNNLGSCVVLLGNMDNPYPVIKFANFMVLTSLYEAHPMVVNEALILHKPIISASFNSVNEIMVHGVTGLICENSTSGVYEGIKKMVVDKELRESIQYNVDNFKYSNDEILLKVKQLLFD